jgi:2-desacetyl-2-hydroxyethyl bacteriochlorophyllide A dehydrogenase
VKLPAARAVWFTARRTAEVHPSEVGEPGPGEVLVRAELSAISAGTELLAYRGQIPPGLKPDLSTVEGDFSFPIKFGYACVGRVLALGPAESTSPPPASPINSSKPRTPDSKLAPGARVFALHPHQSSFAAPAELVIPLPDGISPEQAIFFANLETAFNVVLDAHPRLGDVAAVFGQGVVGLLVVALLRRAGVGRLITVDPFPIRRAAALRLGADLALDPSEATSDNLRELTEGRGLDLAIEASGSEAALQTAVDAVAFQGTVVACAWYGSKPITLDLGRRFHRERVRLISSQVSSLDPALAPRWDRARRTAAVLDLLPQLDLPGLITHRFPLAEAPAAYRLLEERPSEAIQVVLRYDDL